MKQISSFIAENFWIITICLLGVWIYSVLNGSNGPNQQLNNLDTTKSSEAFGIDGSGFIDTYSPEVAKFLGSINNGNGVESTDWEKQNVKLDKGGYVANVECRRNSVHLYEALFISPPPEGDYTKWAILIQTAARATEQCRLAFELHKIAANRELTAWNANQIGIINAKASNPKVKGKMEIGNTPPDRPTYKYR